MFIDEHGLTNSRSGERNAENAILWTLEHIILEKLLDKKDAFQGRTIRFKDALEKCRVRQGLFHQNPSYALITPIHPHDRYMSPDQLIAIVGGSYQNGWKYHKEVWKEIKRQKLRYDNVEPDSPKRYIHPRDFAFYAYCGSKIGKLLIPILAVSCIVSCLRKREDTSGKLLAWVKCQILKEESTIMKYTYKICTKLIKRTHGSWTDVFKIYFPDSEHPIHKLAEEVYR